MTASESLWTKVQRLFFGPDPGMGHAPASRPGGEMPYEILLEGREPIEAWSVCTVCMNVDRTASVRRPRWRCSDCGSDAEHQQPLPQYLDESPIDVLERNLRVIGVEIEAGPVSRRGALGEMRSIYFRDPDGNLVEVAEYVR